MSVPDEELYLTAEGSFNSGSTMSLDFEWEDSKLLPTSPCFSLELFCDHAAAKGPGESVRNQVNFTIDQFREDLNFPVDESLQSIESKEAVYCSVDETHTLLQENLSQLLSFWDEPKLQSTKNAVFDKTTTTTPIETETERTLERCCASTRNDEAHEEVFQHQENGEVERKIVGFSRRPIHEEEIVEFTTWRELADAKEEEEGLNESCVTCSEYKTFFHFVCEDNEDLQMKLDVRENRIVELQYENAFLREALERCW